jgi:hypothetical protein
MFGSGMGSKGTLGQDTSDEEGTEGSAEKHTKSAIDNFRELSELSHRHRKPMTPRLEGMPFRKS